MLDVAGLGVKSPMCGDPFLNIKEKVKNLQDTGTKSARVSTRMLKRTRQEGGLGV